MVPLYSMQAIDLLKKSYQHNNLDIDELIRRIFLIGAGTAYGDWLCGMDKYEESLMFKLKEISKGTKIKIKMPKVFEEMPKFEYDLQAKSKKQKRQTKQEAQEERKKEEVDSIKAQLKHEDRSLKLQKRLMKARKDKKPRKWGNSKDMPNISTEENFDALEKYKTKYDEANKDD